MAKAAISIGGNTKQGQSPAGLANRPVTGNKQSKRALSDPRAT
jgi:hypothetical protein